MAIEFKGNLQEKPLINGGVGNVTTEILARVCWYLEQEPQPTLYLPELKAQLSSNLWVINTYRPSRLIVPAQVMQFDRCQINDVAGAPFVTMWKGDRPLRVLLCPRNWPSRELIDAFQRKALAVLAVDVSWVSKGSTPTEMREIFAAGTYRVFRGLNSAYGPPKQIMLWLHNPLHDQAQAEIDTVYSEAREIRQRRT